MQSACKRFLDFSGATWLWVTDPHSEAADAVLVRAWTSRLPYLSLFDFEDEDEDEDENDDEDEHK